MTRRLVTRTENAVARVAAFSFLSSFIAMLLSPQAARAQSADAHPLHSFSAVTIAPDGSRVASLESDEAPVDGDKTHVSLVVRSNNVAPARVVTLPCGVDVECVPSSPAWSPDSARLAFVLKTPKDAHAIYSVNADGGDLRKLAAFDGTIYALRYAPTGTLAMLATAGARKESRATSAGIPLVGEIGTRVDEQRIATLENGALVFHSPADLYVYEYDWLPDGTGFVGTAAPGDGDDNWWIAKLYAFDATTTQARVIYAPSDPKRQLASPRVSPDGKLVAFIGGIMSDFGSTGGDVFTVPISDASNAAATDLTEGSDSSATSLAWAGPASAQRLVFSTLHANLTGISIVSLAGAPHARVASPPKAQKHVVEIDDRPHELWSEETSISANDAAFSLSSDGNLSAVVREDFEHAPALEVGSLGAWRPLTNDNADVPSETNATPVFWKNDGYDVSGWLLAPIIAPAKMPSNTSTSSSATLPSKHPMITFVHGGPSAAYRPGFVGRGTIRALLRAGYYVFEPNPRGSFGDGEAFTLANVKDFGYGDLRDILTGIDAVERTAPIDESRLGISGYSYGGFMTMWAVTQTHRFKAAVAGGGLSDWLSYYGLNGIDRWMIPFFGASAYDDPAVYTRSSPITFIKNVTTPTFEYGGERDVEVPVEQSLEFQHALVTFGVPTSAVVYAGQGHSIRDPKDRADAERRTLEWFARYLK